MELVHPIVRAWQRRATDDPEAFWADAAEALPWFRRWDTTLDWKPGQKTFRWYSGGRTNLSYNCLDHHVARGWGGHAALVAENERGADEYVRLGREHLATLQGQAQPR